MIMPQHKECIILHVEHKVKAISAFTNVQVTEIREKDIQGFIAKMTLEEPEAVADSDDIAYIQQDTKIYARLVDTSSDSFNSLLHLADKQFLEWEMPLS